MHETALQQRAAPVPTGYPGVARAAQSGEELSLNPGSNGRKGPAQPAQGPGMQTPKRGPRMS
jgi:hypothetical protein